MPPPKTQPAPPPDKPLPPALPPPWALPQYVAELPVAIDIARLGHDPGTARVIAPWVDPVRAGAILAAAEVAYAKRKVVQRLLKFCKLGHGKPTG